MTSPIPEPAPINKALLSVVDQFEQAIRKIADQIDRLESNPGAPCHDKLKEELEVAKQAWSKIREQQQDQLREDAERLRKAWEELESEQRQLLAAQSVSNVVPRSRTPDTREVQLESSRTSQLLPARLLPLRGPSQSTVRLREQKINPNELQRLQRQMMHYRNRAGS